MKRIALLLALAAPSVATAGWYPDGELYLDAFVPDGITVEGERSPRSGTIAGTSIRVSWPSPGCWGARDFLGPDAKKNLGYYFKKIEIVSGPTCVSKDGVDLCTVAGRGLQGPEEKQFQVTMGSTQSYCGRMVLVTGRPGELDARAPILAAFANGAFGPAGAHPAPVAAVAKSPPPGPAVDDYDEYGALGYVLPEDVVLPRFDPAEVPDLGRKVPGPCALYAADAMMGATTTRYTWVGERRASVRREWRSGLGEPLWEQEELTYDEAGRLIRTDRTQATLPPARADYTYDAEGRLLTETDTDELGVRSREHAYDAKGRKVRTTENWPGQAPYVITFEYDDAGRLVREVRATEETRYAYDAHGRVTRQGRATITWSPDGRTKTQVTPAGEGPEGMPGSTDVWIYDAYGNLLHHRGESTYSSSENVYDYACWVK